MRYVVYCPCGIKSEAPIHCRKCNEIVGLPNCDSCGRPMRVIHLPVCDLCEKYPNRKLESTAVMVAEPDWMPAATTTTSRPLWPEAPAKKIEERPKEFVDVWEYHGRALVRFSTYGFKK